MCTDCVIKLDICANFKDQCQKSDVQLRQALFPQEGEQETIDTNNDINSFDNSKDVQQSYSDSEDDFNEAVPESSESNDTSNNSDNTENKYKCKECNKTFKLPSGLKTHEIKHGKKLKCEVCGKEFDCNL